MSVVNRNFGHVRRTLFDNNGVPYADMRALANEEFKAVGELMACSLVHGGPPPSFLSMLVYNYLVDSMHVKYLKQEVDFSWNR